MNKWMFSSNHKDIGTMYFMFGMWSGMIWMMLSMIIRMELSHLVSLLMNHQLYTVIATSHTFISIFL